MRQLTHNNTLCNVRITKYAQGGVCIKLSDAEDGMPYTTATAWMSGLAADEVAIKDYTENEGMLRACVRAGIVSAPVRSVRSGFVDIPICKLLVTE